MVKEGQKFPSFSLADQTGKIHTLESLAGQVFVIYFYPKDDTTGCTTEACEFRDILPRFEGVKVFGASPDSVKSHEKFANKFDLNFPLLADEGHALADSLGIWVEKTLYGRKYMGVERTTFLVDEHGMIQKIWQKVKPANHAAQVAEAVLA